MYPLTREQQDAFDEADICKRCNKTFTDSNRKVRHHDHKSGLYIDALCNACNLQIRYRRVKTFSPLRSRTEYNKDPKDMKFDGEDGDS